MTIEARFRIERGGFTLDAHLTTPAHGVTALFGPSGCGKTTLLRAMAGLESCPGGYLRVGDRIWQEGRHFVAPHQRSLGYVFQEASLFPHLTVHRNLEFGLKRVPQERRRITLDEATALLGVEKLLARYPAGLSGGERQRVAIARALLTSPRLLLMDEPLAALDMASKAEILPFLERLHAEAKIPILYVTHDLEELVRIADHLALLGNGRILKQGPLAEMLADIELPIAREDTAGAVISTHIREHDDKYHLTRLVFTGGEILVDRIEQAVGDEIKIRIHARDVSLALQPPGTTSILNVVRAKVVAMAEQGPGRIMVRLDAGGAPLLARITRKSQASLELEVGAAVHAQIKSVSLSI